MICPTKCNPSTIMLLLLVFVMSTYSFAMDSTDTHEEEYIELPLSPTIYRIVNQQQSASFPTWPTSYYWEETISHYTYYGNLPLKSNVVNGNTRYLTYSGTLTGHLSN